MYFVIDEIENESSKIRVEVVFNHVEKESIMPKIWKIKSKEIDRM